MPTTTGVYDFSKGRSQPSLRELQIKRVDLVCTHVAQK